MIIKVGGGLEPLGPIGVYAYECGPKIKKVELTGFLIKLTNYKILGIKPALLRTKTDQLAASLNTIILHTRPPSHTNIRRQSIMHTSGESN